MYIVLTRNINLPLNSYRFMGILWDHMDSVGVYRVNDRMTDLNLCVLEIFLTYFMVVVFPQL